MERILVPRRSGACLSCLSVPPRTTVPSILPPELVCIIEQNERRETHTRNCSTRGNVRWFSFRPHLSRAGYCRHDLHAQGKRQRRRLLAVKRPCPQRLSPHPSCSSSQNVTKNAVVSFCPSSSDHKIWNDPLLGASFTPKAVRSMQAPSGR